MQPYTPHGDSNCIGLRSESHGQRCNLIPLTGTVTLLPGGDLIRQLDATLYPSRGQ